MVQVAAGGGPAAARRGAPGAAGADQVPEGAAGPVAGLGAGVVAGAAGDRGHVDAQAARVVLRAGAGRRVGAQGGTTGDGEVGAARWRVPAGDAAVGGGGAVGVQRGDAPPGAGVPGRGGGQVTGAVGVDDAEPVGVAGGAGPALEGLEWDGDGDQRGQARPGSRAGPGSGTARAAAAARAAGSVAGSAGTVRSGTGRAGRAGVRGRLVRGGRSWLAPRWLRGPGRRERRGCRVLATGWAARRGPVPVVVGAGLFRAAFRRTRRAPFDAPGSLVTMPRA